MKPIPRDTITLVKLFSNKPFYIDTELYDVLPNIMRRRLGRVCLLNIDYIINQRPHL